MAANPKGGEEPMPKVGTSTRTIAIAAARMPLAPGVANLPLRFFIAK